MQPYFYNTNFHIVSVVLLDFNIIKGNHSMIKNSFLLTRKN